MTAFRRFVHDFSGKRVLIFGLGRLGRGAKVAKIFAQIGCSVTVTDRKTHEELEPSLEKLKDVPLTLRLGEHSGQDVTGSDAIIRNPAVPWDHPLLGLARRRGIPVLMDSSLFARYFPGTLIGVTGTRGKTTTTMMIRRILRQAKHQPILLFGNATDRANLSLLKGAKMGTLAVGELSSWELQGWREEKTSPRIAVVTNIYPDHLDRYRDLHEYVRDKEAIFIFQKASDTLILNRNNRRTRAMAARAPSRIVWFSRTDLPKQWRLRIPGNHNRENAAAALRVGERVGIPRTGIRKSLEGFAGVAHRLETLGQFLGVTYVCDTTATTPVATAKALESLSTPPILLVGGNTKNLPLAPLLKAIRKRTRAVIILRGNARPQLERELAKLRGVKILASSLRFDLAVEKAIRVAQPGDTVLLSPAFTSFAEFANEFERGERFHRLVRSHSRQVLIPGKQK